MQTQGLQRTPTPSVWSGSSASLRERPTGDADPAPATPAPFCGRRVVGVPHTTHWRRAGYLVYGAMPVVSTVAGLAAWQWHKAHLPGSPEGGDSYEAEALLNLKLIGGAVAGGAVLPLLMAAGYTAKRWLSERLCGLRGNQLEPQRQLQRLIDHALAAPLTDDGLEACLSHVLQLQDLFPGQLSGPQVATELARLAGVISTSFDQGPVARFLHTRSAERGCACSSRPLEQLTMLVNAIWQLKLAHLIDAQQLKDTLVSLARHLVVPKTDPTMDVDAMLKLIMGAQGARSTDGPFRLKTALMVDLGDTPYFSRDPAALRDAGEKWLHCTSWNYSSRKDPTLVYGSPDGKSSASGQALRSHPAYQATQQWIAEHIRPRTDLPLDSDESYSQFEDAVYDALDRALRHPPMEQAQLLLEIAGAIQSVAPREDGAFLDGLVSPKHARALIRAVETCDLGASHSAEDARSAKIGLIRRLPQLCQLGTDRALVLSAVDALRRLGAQPEEIEGALKAANQRLTSPGLLHHPWINAPEVQAIQAEADIAKADFLTVQTRR